MLLRCEKLIRFIIETLPLRNNFLFPSGILQRKEKAVFQAGSLYLISARAIFA